MSVTDKVVLITGAAGHLGRAVSAAAYAQGASLALVGRDRDGLRAACGEEDERRFFAPADLLDRAQARAAADAALARFGRIDVLLNLAGGFRMGPTVHETGDEAWRAMLELNAGTLLHASAAVVPHMLARRRGAIVNVGAFSAQRGPARMGAYAAAKAGVQRLTESMAAELREQGIHVNCVLPTLIDTPDNRAAMPEADPSRWVAPADLAAVILFLAGDGARAIHGAALPVTGLS